MATISILFFLVALDSLVSDLAAVVTLLLDLFSVSLFCVERFFFFLAVNFIVRLLIMFPHQIIKQKFLIFIVVLFNIFHRPEKSYIYKMYVV